MRIRHFRTGRQALTSVMLLLLCSCVQQMQSVQPEPAEEAVSAFAQIQNIVVSDDGATVEIISDRPIVYTYYTLDNPSRVIVDLAQTAADKQQPAAEINKGAVKRIDISKHEFGSGVLSRVEIALAGKSEISAALDKENKKRLLLTIPAPAITVVTDAVKPAETQPVAAAVETPPVAATAATALPVVTTQIVDPKPVTVEKAAEKLEPAAAVKPEPATTVDNKELAVVAVAEKQSPVVVQEPVKEAVKAEVTKATENLEPVNVAVKAEPLKAEKAVPLVIASSANRFAAKPNEKTLTAIIKNEDSLLLEISGGVETFKLFRLSQPERLVLDIPKTKSAIAVRTIEINAFGLGNGRLGASPDKLRIVFDATAAAIPAYSAVKNSSGLEILFGEAATSRKIADSVAPAVSVQAVAKEAAAQPVEQKTSEAVALAAPAAAVEPVKESVKEAAPVAAVQAVEKEAAAQPAAQSQAAAIAPAAPVEPVKESVKEAAPVAAIQAVEKEAAAQPAAPVQVEAIAPAAPVEPVKESVKEAAPVAAVQAVEKEVAAQPAAPVQVEAIAPAAAAEPVKEAVKEAAPVAAVQAIDKEVVAQPAAPVLVEAIAPATPVEPVKEAVKEAAPVASSQAAVKEAATQQSEPKPVEKASAPPSEPAKETARVVQPEPPAVVPVPAAAPAVVPQISTAMPALAKPVKKVAGNIEAIEFSQADGNSRITVRTSGGCISAAPVKSNRGLLLTLNDCRVPAKLQRQLDTTGFESVITGIAPFSVKGKAPAVKIAVNFKGAVANSVNRDGDTLVWEFAEPAKVLKSTRTQKSQQPQKVAKIAKVQKASPLAADAAPAVEREFAEQKTEPAKNGSSKATDDAFQLDKSAQQPLRQGKAYSGRKVTLEFSDADIRKIFQLLAEVSNKNFLVSDDVTGTITLKLVNVPWDQALDVILENKGLGMQMDGNIVQIRPKTKMKSLDDEAVEMRFTEEKRMPLSTVIFDINFATLGDIETQFKNLKSKRPDSSISSDARTNKIIVVDIDPNIRKMRALLESLDVPEKQVMIEARIVEASSSFARDLGVKWNFGYQDGSASIANINNITGSMGGVVTTGLAGSTGGVAAGVSFGKLLSNIQLDMRLSAASTVGQVKIISTPKVLTVNNKAAKISQGQMIPYQNTSSADGAKTEFIEAALSLEVTPHITADGSVNMKIKASNNTAGVGSPPPINKKEATTELVVKNGETTVIGGIYVDSETEGDTGVPYLSDIPMLGWLFKSNTKSKVKNEMLIFITPKIMN